MRQQNRLLAPSTSLPRLCAAFALAALGAAGAFLASGRTSAQVPGPCDPPNGNQVVCENQKPGNLPSEWDIVGAGDDTIQGFATAISVNKGSTISFKIDTNASAYHLDIYRMGYYGGMGARKVATVQPSVALPQNQPDCLSDEATGLLDCGNWGVSASWAVPATAVSGIYFAKVIRNDTLGASHVVFVVRDDASHSDLLFQTSDTTWQAYNQYGGNSLYVGGPGTNPGRAYKVSYNRPFTTARHHAGRLGLQRRVSDGPLLEATATTSATPPASTRIAAASLTLAAQGFPLGRPRRVLVRRAARPTWKRRATPASTWRSSAATRSSGRRAGKTASRLAGTPYRTLVTYKETHANAKIDPTATWTGTWADPRFSPPADGGKPQNALTGTHLPGELLHRPRSQVPAADGKMRFWREHRRRHLAPGGVADTDRRHARLRVGPGPGQRVPARPGSSACRTRSSTERAVLQDCGSTYAPARRTLR